MYGNIILFVKTFIASHLGHLQQMDKITTQSLSYKAFRPQERVLALLFD